MATGTTETAAHGSEGWGVARVVVTGSECTGKTTLAARLAAEYGTVWVREHARAYAAARTVALTAADVEPIAHGQIAAEEAGLHQLPAAPRTGGHRLLVLDTDLISTVVYARHYYGACPAWIEQAARRRRGGLYLLCCPDVPWLPEPGLRDRGDRREELHGLFVATLGELGANVAAIGGGWEERAATARRAIDALLRQRSP